MLGVKCPSIHSHKISKNEQKILHWKVFFLPGSWGGRGEAMHNFGTRNVLSRKVINFQNSLEKDHY